MSGKFYYPSDMLQLVGREAGSKDLRQAEAYRTTLLLSASKKTRVECPRQQFSHLKRFALTLEIREDNRGASREFPDDLPARSARWR